MWKKSDRVTKWQNCINTLRIYITIYHTYLLLHCKGHNQMISNNRTINVETIELTK